MTERIRRLTLLVLAASVQPILAPAAAAQAASVAQPGELSLAETEERVKADVAQRAKLEPEALRVVESADKTWPDAGLGCMARRGVLGRSPVSGYRVVVAAGERRFTYHTDRHGKLQPCDKPAKPLDRIE
jgi:hypothetical protein